MWWIIPRKWCVFLVCASLGFTKSSKCGLPAAPIGIFGSPPNTLFSCVSPPNCCTWGLRRIIVVAANSTHYFCPKQFSFSPIIWSMIVRKCPRRRSAAPKLRWCPGITACNAILRAVQKSCKTAPMGLESLSTTIIYGVPNTANQFEITFRRAISAVCPAFSLFR